MGSWAEDLTGTYCNELWQAPLTIILHSSFFIANACGLGKTKKEEPPAPCGDPSAPSAIGAVRGFRAISMFYCALLQVELYIELRNSRISPHTLQVPILVGPFGLSISQKCTQNPPNAAIWTAAGTGDPTILPTSGRRL